MNTVSMRSQSRCAFAALTVLAVCSILLILLMIRCVSMVREKSTRLERKVYEEEEAERSVEGMDPLHGGGRGGRGGMEMEKRVVDEREDTDSEESREEERIVGRIETCLFATNMSSYFEKQGFLSVARDNARHMIRTLRTIIPRTFSSDYLSPCWKADFKGSIQDEDETVKWVVGNKEIVTPFSDIEPRKILKNPSHNNGTVSSSLICLPKFFIAGFPKCGTTFLYCLMGKRFGGGLDVQALTRKEPHWWVKYRLNFRPNKPTVERIPIYLFHFIDVALQLASTHYQTQSQQPLTIDGSPNVIFDWPHWYKDEPGLTNYCMLPAVIPEVLPDSKFVVIMRNPVDMLYSAFWYSCRSPKDHFSATRNGPNVFHERIAAKVKRFMDCNRTHPLAICMNEIYYNLFTPDLPACGRTRLEVGMYYIHIQKWLSVVPRDNFVFLTLEELSKDVNLVERKLVMLLGPDYPHNLTLREDSLSTCRTNSQSSFHQNPWLHMREDTREMLTTFFRPFNQMLADLLGDKKFLWDEPLLDRR